MIQAGIYRLRQGAQLLRKRIVAPALVLMYHRVVDLPSDPQLLGVAPSHFAEHIEILRKRYRPVSLLHLASALRERKLPRRAVVVTFDDGYADNLHNAKPLLERHDIPATVFVTTGHIANRYEFWWDELDRLLLQPGAIPATLHLTINGNSRDWQIGAGGVYTEDDYRRYRSWHIEQPSDPGPRQRLYRSLYQLLHALSQAERQKVRDELRVWAAAEPSGRPTHRTLTREEVIQLGTGELIEVGAHTVTHPVLAALPVPVQRDEIQRSKADLEQVLGRPVTSFAYPHGSGTAETVAIVREAGFVCACSSHPDMVWRDADPFQVPRVVVRDWDGDTFARQLWRWLGA